MAFSLTKYNHVNKFTLYETLLYLKSNHNLTDDISMLVLFENILKISQADIDINVYGQVKGGYRYSLNDKQKKKLLGEWDDIGGVYRWYRSPDNVNSHSEEYFKYFDDEDMTVMNNYFFHKADLLNFIGANEETEQDKKNSISDLPINNQTLKALEPQDQAELNRINTELEQANATIQAKDEQIAELEKQLEQAKRAESAVKSDDNLEYEGYIPLSTNEEKLADFIDLLLKLGNITNKQGSTPTYSELYTILDNKFRNRKKPSKNTIRKYMNKP